MKKAPKIDPDMQEEYDFSKGVRGKYAGRLAPGSNIVVLDPDVAGRFPDSKAVNDALRAIPSPARRTRKLPAKTWTTTCGSLDSG